MWNANDYIKFAAKALIFINILVGLLFVAYGLYVVFLPWGDAESYQALGICLTLFGVAFTCGSVFGYLSVDYQLKRFGGGWTGRSAIIFYDFLLLVLLAALVLAYIYGNAWLSEVKSAVDDLYANPASTPSYSMPEKVIRDHFNKLFFTASDSCKNEYTWFWQFIDDVCPSAMSEANCQGCGYAVTFCIADEYTCYESASAPPGQSFACPYVICREGYLRWLNRTANKYFHPIVYACWGITVTILLLSLFLICHNQTKRLVVKVADCPEGDGARFVGTNPVISTQPVLVQPKAILAPRTSLEATTTTESAGTVAVGPMVDKLPLESISPPSTSTGTVALPPELTLSNKSLDLDTENAIIDTFIALSAVDGSVPGIDPPSMHSAHRDQTGYVKKKTVKNYSVVRTSHQEGMHVSSRASGGVALDAYSYDAYEEGHQRSNRHSHSHSREYEQHRGSERSARHSYNPHQHQHQHQFETHMQTLPLTPGGTDDVELEIAIMESIESTHKDHRSHHKQHAHHSHHIPHSQHPHHSHIHADPLYQPLPISPGGADVELEIAMMESLTTHSREDFEVERALRESVQQPRKKPLGIPTHSVASPINRTVPRYETGRSTDSELDQAIIQSILNKK